MDMLDDQTTGAVGENNISRARTFSHALIDLLAAELYTMGHS